MAAIAGESVKLAAERLTAILSGGVDVETIDRFLAAMFELAGIHGNVSCALAESHSLRLESKGTLWEEAEIPFAKGKLRLVCARLAVRCGEWGQRAISPYGDSIEIDYPPAQRAFRIQFQNTTAAQEIVIDAVSANGTESQ